MNIFGIKALCIRPILVIAFINLLGVSYGQPDEKISSQQWIEDIDFMVEKVKRNFPDFSTRVNENNFNQQITQLKDAVPSLTNTQVILGLQRLLSFTRDESCFINLFQPRLNYKILPLRSYWFRDGIFIYDATNDYKQLVGQQIRFIGKTSIDKVYDILRDILPGDNEYAKRISFLTYSQIPSLLEARGIISGRDSVEITFDSGQKAIVKPAEVSVFNSLSGFPVGERQSPFSGNKSSAENFWYEWDGSTKTLFIQFLRIADSAKDGIMFSEFVKSIKDLIQKNDIQRLIIDNRFGGGGDGFKLKALTDMIREEKEINQDGRLFILTSNNTRGTLCELTSILTMNTKALLVGESTNEGPNFVGDNAYTILPHSKITVFITNIFWPTSFKEDTRSTIDPDLVVEYSYGDWAAKRDPWMHKLNLFKKVSKKNSTVPDKVAKGISGTYLLNSHDVSITQADNQLHLTISRKPRSFFEIHTQLYSSSTNMLATDIKDLFVLYETDKDGSTLFKGLRWQKVDMKME